MRVNSTIAENIHKKSLLVPVLLAIIIGIVLAFTVKAVKTFLFFMARLIYANWTYALFGFLAFGFVFLRWRRKREKRRERKEMLQMRMGG